MKNLIVTIDNENDLDNLNLPNIQEVSNEDALVSSETEVINEDSSDGDIKNISESIEKSEQEEIDEVVGGNKSEENIWSYKEVDETYNKGISKEEKQAYALYFSRKMGKPVEGGFSKYNIADTEENRKMLMQKGVLAHDPSDKDDYVPMFYYCSGNVHEKLKNLRYYAPQFAEIFGSDILKNQEEQLLKAVEKVNDKRLFIGGDDDRKRIFIKIDGAFAYSFKVSPTYPLNKKLLTDPWSSLWVGEKSEMNYEKGIREKKLKWKYRESSKGIEPAERSGNRNVIQDWTTNKLSIRNAFLHWYKDFQSYGQASDYNIIYPTGVGFKEVKDFYWDGFKNSTNKKKIPSKYIESNTIKDSWYVKLNEIRKVGEQFLALFLDKALQDKDKIGIETVWNQRYNGYLPYDVDRVPILFRFVKKAGTGEMDIRPEKRRAIGYNMLNGSTCLAYGVGMGKTFCSIFSIAQNLDMGLAKRPLLLVPNSVYPQFLQEIKTLLPQYKVNGIYNCRGIYKDVAQKIEDKSITIMAYSGLSQLGIKNKKIGSKVFQNLVQIVNQDRNEVIEDDVFTKNKINTKASMFLGLIPNTITVKDKQKKENIEVEVPIELFIDEMKLDYISIDEAHNFKKLFASVKPKTDLQGNKQQKSGYKISGSAVSSEAMRVFCITQYIQEISANKNTLLLTATPFTNSPLEIYSMLSMLNYDKLKSFGFEYMQDFFDFYVSVGVISAVDTSLNPISKEIIEGFKNVVSMQSVLYSVIDKPTKEEENAKVVRPNKIVLPLWDKKVGEQNLSISESNQVTTLLRMNSTQVELWGKLSLYAEGKADYDDFASEEDYNLTDCGSIKAMKKKAKKDSEEGNEKADYNSTAMRSVFALTYGRSIALNPYVYRFAGYKKNPTPAEFVQSSPKIEYAIECIKTVQTHHKKTKTPMSGQVIFMTKGTNCFNYITDYCVEYLGLKQHEVGIIGSGNYIGKKKYEDKGAVQDAFLGRKLDMSDPLNPKYVDIPDSDRIKVLVGSSSIKEGVNLQYYSSCLYVCEVDWNPTDMTQLEGRIWRQKNAFANVRIVIPLLENSHDAFIYSKLQEKTGRINQIWSNEGGNEFDLDQFNPEEMTRQVSRNPKQIAELIKKDKEKQVMDKILEDTIALNSFRKVRVLSKDIQDVENKNLVGGRGVTFNFSTDSSDDSGHNSMLGVYLFLQNFRPSLITKPFLKSDVNNLLSPTESQGQRNVKFNMDNLNYTFKEIADLMNQFRKEGIIEYPRGYKSDWDKVIEYPTFEVGEKVKFKTRRGDKEGTILENLSPYETDNSLIRYDIDLGDDNVAEDISISNHQLESLDNISENKEEELKVGGDEIKLGSQKSIDILKNIRRWYQLNSKDFSTNVNSIDFLGKRYLNRNPYGDWILNDRSIDTWKSFAKIKDFYQDGWLKDIGYALNWSIWQRDVDKLWKDNLRPQGINTDDELTQRITKLREGLGELDSALRDLDNEEYLKELEQEAILEIEEREAMGDKPLTPLEGARAFAKPNPDYLGNKYLDIFDDKYLEEKFGIKKEEPKKEEPKKEEPKKEEPISDDAQFIEDELDILNLLLADAEGEEKEFIQDEIDVLNILK